jgi:diguanylate cyclase (GGDEF)-like protein
MGVNAGVRRIGSEIGHMASSFVGPPLTGTILIADDDADFRRLLVRRATRMGLTVVEADSGTEALQAVRRSRFDAVVVDVYMPGCSGVEVALEARKLDPHVQALVLTGSATLENAVEALRAGVYDFLTKPLESLDAFEMSLSRALELESLLRENARLFAEVQRLALTDSLTGLFNRRKLEEALEVEVERSRRYGRALSIVMIDVDGLKRINDTRGHHVGDAVLQAAAGAIRGEIRKVDLASRLGGDEFLLLLPEAGSNDAAGVAGRIFHQLSTLSVHGERVAASAGVAQWSAAFPTPGDFMRAADRALYQAKRGGGGHIAVVFPSPEGSDETIEEWLPQAAHT